MSEDFTSASVDVWPLPDGEDVMPGIAAGVSGSDLFKYLPVLARLLAALETGTGTFSTWTPLGKRWITVADHAPLPGAAPAADAPAANALAAPGAFGIDRLTKKVERLAVDTRAGFARLERIERSMATQVEEMDAKLQNIADTETKLGTDIQQVVDYLKNNPNPTDLTAQLAKLDQIGQTLIDTDAATLANLPPAPQPAPGPGRRH